MKPVSYTEDLGTEKGFCALEAHKVLLCITCQFLEDLDMDKL